MIVRTYGRRNRCLSRSCSDSSFDGTIEDEDNSFRDRDRDRDPLSQDSIYNFTFSSSQDSTPWTQFDSDSQPSLPPPPSSSCRPPLPNSKSKKSRNLKLGTSVLNGKVGRSSHSMPAPATATLMETQEFGEMMEHVDEVNFALDGLRKGQPARIRRASLLSLLSICSTATQRRLLRTQGMAKTILDAILSLSLDDSPSTLAAAALFYVLASDGEGEQLLDSPICIRFLLKLLSPYIPASSEEKRPTVGSKLLALCRNTDTLGDKSKRLDASSTAIISKVEEILLSYKEIQSSSGGDEGVDRPELTPKWIALLTMEKACVSTVSIEDTSATVRKVGGNFKETLRELGGLDAVFDVAAECHSIMERWSDDGTITESQDATALQTIVLLLKCLKIMENATFLSKDNQNHLLEMDGKSESKKSSLSFTGLVVSAIKILSDLSYHRSSLISGEVKCHCNPNGKHCASDSPFETEHEAEQDGSLSRSSPRRCHGMENASNEESLQASQKRKKPSSQQSVYTVSSSDTLYSADVKASRVRGFNVPKKRKKSLTSLYAVSSSETSSFSADKKEDKPSTSSSCNGTSQSSSGRISRHTRGRKTKLGLGRRSCVTENSKYSGPEEDEDPFAFDEGEIKLSKWAKSLTTKETSQAQKIRRTVIEPEVMHNQKPMTSQSESNNRKECLSCDISCSPSVEVDPILLSDCILAAVKVLMNLTNDNPVGCNQIASCGGLETLSALISGFYPSYSTSITSCSQTAESLLEQECSTDAYENEKHFTDQEIDFIVAILGLLVNLVEKDSLNRLRLAATSVSVPTSGGSGKTKRNIIPLLCSIFLANQGSGETSGDRNLMPWDEDEKAVLEGEREAEKMIIEAYAALLLAFLSTESKKIREAIARCLPDHNLEVLVPVLERFVTFHLTLNMISPETHATVCEVIESLKGT